MMKHINPQMTNRFLLVFCLFVCSAFNTILLAADDTWTKCKEGEKLATGTRVKIYPYKKAGVANMALSGNKTDAVLTSAEKAGTAGSIWTLLDTGDNHFYLVNDLGLYWTDQQTNGSSSSICLTPDKNRAVKVGIYEGDNNTVKFITPNWLYLDNLAGSNYQYNWLEHSKINSSDIRYYLYVSRTVSRLVFNTTKTTIKRGSSSTLRISYAPNSATKAIAVKSSDTSVATVTTSASSDGTIDVTVTGHNVGTATVTAAATDGSGLTASCAVTVMPLKASAITFNKETVSVVKTEDAHLILTFNPSEADNKSVAWTSSDESVATVTQDMNATYPLKAIVSTHKVGQAVITATAQDGSGVTATCAVNVTPLKVTSIKLASNASVMRTVPTQLTVNVSPAEADNQTVKWSSLTPEIATVDDKGVVTGLKKGTASIRVEATDGSGVYSDFSIMVRLVDKVSLPSSLSLTKTTTQKLTAVVMPVEPDNQEIIWTSDDESIATVDAQGNVTGVKVGTTTITATATDGSKMSASCTVTVTPLKTESINFSSNKVDVQRGSTTKLSVTVLPNQADNKTVSWMSSDETVATVSENGLVTAINGGTATITAKTQDGSALEATCLVHVLGWRFDYNKKGLRATLLPNDYSGNITIPETTTKDMVEYTVDCIAPNCFEGAELNTLTIPATVQRYGTDAFKGASIKHYTYNGTMGNWYAIKFANAAANPIQATESKALVLDSVEIKSVIVPSSIKELLPYTFFGCTSIDTVEIHSLVSTIGDSCFAGSHIKQFAIQATTLPTLGRDALAANIGTAIVPQDFYGEYYTAGGWKDLENIISSTDKKTGSYFVVDKSLYLLNKETGEISICNPVDAISQTAEYKGTIVLPTEVEYNHRAYPLTAIGPSCFKDNTAVDSIALPAILKTIEASAFSGCKGLGANFLGSLSQWCAIKFDDGTSNPMGIKGRLMIGGKELTELTVPSDVREVNDYAFYGCANLTRAEIGEQVESVGTSSFAGCTGITDLKLLCFCEVPAGSFISCPLVRIESGNEKFWQSISSNFASTLETAIVSDDYTGMCPMFNGYTKLKNITLSDKITAITSFEGCTSLTEFTVPEEVLTISENAFKNCRNLKTLNLPANYGMSIDDNAFVNCTGLETVNYGGDVVDWCSLEFSNKYSNPMYYAQNVLIQGQPLTTLDVPEGSGAKYQNYAFVNLKSLRKVVISSITGGLSTFSGCSNLEEIHLTGPQTAEVLMPAFKGEFDGVDKTTCKLYVPADLVSKYQQAYIWKDFLNILPLSDAPEEISIQSITFTVQPHDMTVGETQTLQVEIAPDNADNKTLAWSSSDTSIATVSASGVVSSLAPGTVTVTAAATDGSGVTANCTIAITAKAQPVTAIQLSQTTATMKTDETLQLTATIIPDDASNKEVVWSSSNESVATVTQEGLVQALAAGEAIITAATTDGTNLSATCTVAVEEPQPEEILISSIEMEKSITLTEGETYQMQYTILPENATNQTLEWSSADESIVKVDNYGVVSTIKAGTTTIYAACTDDSGQFAACSVTVVKAGGGDEPGGDDDKGKTWIKVTESNFAALGNGSIINIYPHEKKVKIYVENGELNAKKVASQSSSRWKLIDTGDGYFYIQNLDGLYWAAEDNYDMFATMTCTTDKSAAAKVSLVWNPVYNGVAFKNSATGKYINDLCDSGTTFNWWNDSDEALTGDPYSTFDLKMWTGKETDIHGVTSDENDNAVFYTLSGVKLPARPSQEGIYIRVQDGKSQKVVLRKR